MSKGSLFFLSIGVLILKLQTEGGVSEKDRLTRRVSTTVFHPSHTFAPLSSPTFGVNTLPLTSSFQHLGITRDSFSGNNLQFVKKRISVLRHTSYLVLGNVLTFKTQLHPFVALNILSTYVIPAAISGLESLILSPAESDLLSSAHYNILRQLLYLPKYV